MQNMDVKVSGNIDVNVNLGVQTGQEEGQSYFSPEFIETLRQFGIILQQASRKENVLSCEKDKDLEILSKGGVLFDPCDIVMVVNPECDSSAMTVEESREILDIFEEDGVILPFPLMHLKMSCKPDSIVTIEDRSYLTSTAVVFDEEDVYSKSLDSEKLQLVKRIMDIQCESIFHGGQRVRALQI